MNSRNGRTYTLTYTGKHSADVNTDKIIRDFATLFDTTTADVKPFFTGEKVFVKKELNLYTANLYQKAFKNIGAICDIIEEPVNEDSADIVACPNCGLRQPFAEICPICSETIERIKLKTCPRCGIESQSLTNCQFCGFEYDEKFLGKISEEDRSDIKKAITFISLGTSWIAISLVFNFIVDFIDFNGNFIPIFSYKYFLVSNFLLYLGSRYYVRVKGYPSWFGLLGLLNLPGFSLLMILPDKKNKNELFTWDKIRLTAVIIFVISTWWSVSYIIKPPYISDIIELAEELHKNRHDYPSNMLDSSPEMFREEVEKMRIFIRTASKQIDLRDILEHHIVKTGDIIFNELAQFFIWIQYQQFLHERINGEYPDHLKFSKIKDLMLSFQMDIINNRYFWRKKSAFIVPYAQWMLGKHPNSDFNILQIGQLNEIVCDIQKKMSDKNPSFSLNYYKNSYDFIASIDLIDGAIIEIKLKQDDELNELSGKTIAMAMVRNQLVQIGGNLYAKFLDTKFSVFSIGKGRDLLNSIFNRQLKNQNQ